MTQIVGVDVGGTFTDLVLFDTETESVKIAKVPSTPENQAFGVMRRSNLLERRWLICTLSSTEQQ